MSQINQINSVSEEFSTQLKRELKDALHGAFIKSLAKQSESVKYLTWEPIGRWDSWRTRRKYACEAISAVLEATVEELKKEKVLSSEAAISVGFSSRQLLIHSDWDNAGFVRLIARGPFNPGSSEGESAIEYKARTADRLVSVFSKNLRTQEPEDKYEYTEISKTTLFDHLVVRWETKLNTDNWIEEKVRKIGQEFLDVLWEGHCKCAVKHPVGIFTEEFYSKWLAAFERTYLDGLTSPKNTDEKETHNASLAMNIQRAALPKKMTRRL